MSLSYTTIIAGTPGKSQYLRNHCDGFMNKMRGKTIRVSGSRVSLGTDESEMPRRSFLTVGTTPAHKVGAFIELRTIAGSDIFKSDFLLNAIDKPVWDSPRTVEIAAVGVDVRHAETEEGAAEMVHELLKRSSAYLWPLGIRRMVVRCGEEDLDLFALSPSATKKLLTPNNEFQQWLGVRIDHRWNGGAETASGSDLSYTAAQSEAA